MNLILQNIEILLATEIVRDDVADMFYFNAAKRPINTVVPAYHVLHGIPVGAKYLHFEFADKDTGEVWELNTSSGVHNAIMRSKTYPDFISTPVDDFCKQNDIEFYSFRFGEVNIKPYGRWYK